MSRRILVTGGCGYLGEVVIPRLLEHPLIERVVALDHRPGPTQPHAKLRSVRADIRNGYLLRSILEEEAIDAVVHLAFIDSTESGLVLAREINLQGTLVVLEAADKSSAVRKMIIAGSTSSYGARRGNPRQLMESDSLRASSLPYALHKRRMEEEIGRSMPQIRASLQVCILRLATIVGEGEHLDGPVRRARNLSMGLRPLLHKGGLQFLSEQDAATAFCRALEAQDCRGAFNVAPDDSLTTAEAYRCLDKSAIPLPLWMIWSLLFVGRKLFGSAIPEGIAAYLAHPIIASNAKIKKSLGFSCALNSREALTTKAAPTI
jgi:UDP-glucose 4-epimerase